MENESFAGITVIDLTRVSAGLFAAYQPGVPGASVSKVENPRILINAGTRGRTTNCRAADR